MKRSTKGAVAAAAGVALLLGGAGTVAFWTATGTVPGGTISSGSLALTDPACGGWALDTGEAVPTTYTAGDPLVPGDVLARSCDFTIQAEGNHLRATVDASAPSVTGALAPALTVGVGDLEIGGTAVTEFTEADDGSVLSVDVTVTFVDPGTADNSTNVAPDGLQAVLDDITVTATQAHS